VCVYGKIPSQGTYPKGGTRRASTLAVILVASNRDETCAAVAQILQGTHLPVVHAGDVSDSFEALHSRPVSVVLCEGDLPGGGWKPVLSTIQSLSGAPLLVVTSPCADTRLWAEVLNLGGYDVLAQPFDAEEVRRILLQACSRAAEDEPNATR
jgi:DNA-binding NtrC family response regulator